MLTPKQNMLEVIRGGNPDRIVNQYEAVQLLFHPFMFSSPLLSKGQENVVNAWGVTNTFPEGVPTDVFSLRGICMIDMERLKEMGRQQGFSEVVLLECSTIELKPEVRRMCEANTCHMYGRCWSCPPGCGSLEECREKVGRYRQGILVQTVGELEDALDGESMMETEARHKEYFYAFEKVLRELFPDMLAIGAGCCTKCGTCTYPDQPCRFPKQAFSSMEAYGMLVTQVCQANSLKYYYGPCTIAYTSCYLLE